MNMLVCLFGKFVMFEIIIFDATWSVAIWVTLYLPARYDMAEAYCAS